MKSICFPSPNFNARKHSLDMLVLHYTGMQTGQAALDRLCDPAAEVSAHYMIRENGEIVQLVDEDKRAWHAGISSWQGDTDLNSRSIGIEIVNRGHDWPQPDGRPEPYPDPQISALIQLIQDILKRWPIPPTRIVGHSDIAPARKIDPGEHFPWARLAEAGIGLWPQNRKDPNAAPALLGRGLGSGDQGEAVHHLQRQLQIIGYQLAETGSYDSDTAFCIGAFQRHWVQDRVSGQADLLTIERLEQIAELYKTC